MSRCSHRFDRAPSMLIYGVVRRHSPNSYNWFGAVIVIIGVIGGWVLYIFFCRFLFYYIINYVKVGFINNIVWFVVACVLLGVKCVCIYSS